MIKLEPIQVFPKGKIPEHWVIQSGLRDAVPDVVEVAVTKPEAIRLAGYPCHCNHIDWHYKSVERRQARQESASKITVSVL